MENVGIFYVRLEHLTAIWYTSWSFGNVAIFWYIFHHFGILCQEKSGNPVYEYQITLSLSCLMFLCNVYSIFSSFSFKR
jgi:hypothetical protein